MTVLLNSEIFILTLVIGVYLAAVWLFRKTRLSILNPLLVSIPVLALITHFLGISYESFEKGSRIAKVLIQNLKNDTDADLYDDPKGQSEWNKYLLEFLKDLFAKYNQDAMLKELEK